jgi:hypothetical protein
MPIPLRLPFPYGRLNSGACKMPYEDLIADVQRRVDNGQGATIEQSRALFELLARYREGLAEIRAVAAEVVRQLGPPDLPQPVP